MPFPCWHGGGERTFCGRAGTYFSTFNVTGTELFSSQSFLRTICVKPNGSFLEQICLLHSGWDYFDGADIPPAFVAVGDTLEIWIDCAKNEAPLSGRGFKIMKNIYAVFAQIACHCGAAAPTFRGQRCRNRHAICS